TLVNRRETQLVAYWIAGIDCMNGTAHWSSPLFPPRSHGSGAAPLAKLLLAGHKGRIPNLTRAERDLLLAWIDSNGLYHGTWDYTTHGCAIQCWDETRQALTTQMQKAGCARCHSLVENDWINLKDPQFSRILRAPLPAGRDGFGLALCRDRKVDPQKPRVRLLWKGYAHAIQPLEAFAPQAIAPRDTSGAPQVSFASTRDPNYQAFLEIIRDARDKALAAPRVDMPGAEVLPGECRQFIPPPLPKIAPPFTANVNRDGVVELTWERSARTIGLEAEVHRGDHANFAPDEHTLLTRTTLFRFADKLAPAGMQHYALVLLSRAQRSEPAYAAIMVPPPLPPPAPTELKGAPASYSVRLRWQAPQTAVAGYNVYRAKAGSKELQKLTPEPVRCRTFVDSPLQPQVAHRYVVRAVSMRGLESEPTAAVEAAATVIQEPVFVAAFEKDARGALLGGETLSGKIQNPGRTTQGVLDIQNGGHVTYPHHSVFDLAQPFALECWVWFNEPGQMPVIASCGAWKQSGWFLQRIGRGWRWHVGGVDCDGGQLTTGRWIHLAATWDGKTARLFQDGM
ncbi:MAG: hypothetical protein N2689_17335, partial [Verrucomicrobiae bacterium]|nr:hypothetical protein [Verrucomicrobiae bacterium]